MKAALLAVVATLVIPTLAAADPIDPQAIQLWDVVETTEGTILKGVIVEWVPGTSVRVVVLGGSSIVVPIATVVRVGRELNPGFASQPAHAAPSATLPLAARHVAAPPTTMAARGLRIGLQAGLAIHEDLSTFLVSGRIGWEIPLDRWGLIPGVVFDFMPQVGSYGANAGALHASVRAAYRGSTASPFFGFGIGPDFLGNDVSLGLSVGAGIELVLHPRFALTGEARYHRGFADSSYIGTLEFGAITFGAELRL